jgi:formylglycine-generating enzyme required for sulfatase activity
VRHDRGARDPARRPARLDLRYLAPMVRRAVIVAGFAVLVGGLVAVATAAPPAGYRCGKGGKPNARAQACTCPAGKKPARNADDVAVCVAKSARAPATPVTPPTTTFVAPPPAPDPTCPTDMVPVRGGSFDMGSPLGTGGDADEIPSPKGKRTVTLTGFCLDRTEVTAEAYASCVGAKACSPAADTVEWDGLDDATRKPWNDAQLCNANQTARQQHPINCVTWDQAVAFCGWQKKRLPTEAEWEYAARGTDGRAYAWDPALGAPTPKLADACDADCQALGKRMGFKWKSIGDSDGFEATAPVGSFPDGSSPFGALDLTGNVWEWVADEYARYEAGAVKDPAPAETALVGDAKHFTLRGGGWDSDNRSYLRAANRLHAKRSMRSTSYGFRCARAGK